MTDEGGFSVWGAEDDDIGKPNVNSLIPASTSQEKPRLFGDLEEANADWGVQPSSVPIKEAEGSSEAVIPQHDSTTDTSIPAPIHSSTISNTTFEEHNGRIGQTSKQLDSAGFDDFDEDEFAEGGARVDDDDDEFGDFGDFGEEEAEVFEDSVAPSTIVPRREWEPLQVSKDTSLATLERDIREILSPSFPNGRAYPFHDGAASQLSQDRIRQVEGEAQVLVREESRALWHSLIAQPSLRPVDWMRSSTRRQHLIALGIPINLDEVRVSDGAGSKALPPLALKYEKKPGEDEQRAATHRNGTHEGREARAPEMDMTRVKELNSLTEDQLTLLALPALRDMSREMESLTRQASALLTYHLSQREAHNADAEMYNGLIRDLVTGAANRYGGQAANVKRSSTLRKASTSSGRNSPAPNQVR